MGAIIEDAYSLETAVHYLGAVKEEHNRTLERVLSDYGEQGIDEDDRQSLILYLKALSVFIEHGNLWHDQRLQS
jgi:hypothetical protein